MAKKQRSNIRNWSDYNKALVKRGSLTLWFDAKSVKKWHTTGKNGLVIQSSLIYFLFLTYLSPHIQKMTCKILIKKQLNFTINTTLTVFRGALKYPLIFWMHTSDKMKKKTSKLNTN